VSWLNSKTTGGAQYVNYQFAANYAGSNTLPPGAQTVTAGANKFASEATTTSKTLGFFIEEALAFRERLFVTMALRTDQNSAFGTNFQRVVYPKASVSYLISEEGFFPKPSWLGQFRLRSAYGASGQQPGPNDALRFFAASSTSLLGADAPTLVFSALGNADLKPERATEFEAGFETRMFGDRVSLEATYYNKKTQDALIAAVIPPTAGAGATTRLSNIGAVRNAGVEGLLTAQLVSRRAFAWDVTLNGSTNANKLVSLGGTPPVIGTTISQKEGYPLHGYWTRPILGYEDKDGDNLLEYSANAAQNEVMIGDTAVFLGYSTPRHELSVTNGLDLFGRALRIQALVDYKGGHKKLNNTERFRCDNTANCQGRNDPTASFFEQARVIARTVHPSGTFAGFIEDASFVRFRELSATYRVPTGISSRWLRSGNTSIAFSARNLGILWDRWSGIDPETNYNTYGDAPVDFFTLPTPTYYTLRVNLGF
jgi:hypothetical protein